MNSSYSSLPAALRQARAPGLEGVMLYEAQSWGLQLHEGSLKDNSGELDSSEDVKFGSIGGTPPTMQKLLRERNLRLRVHH